MFLTMKRYYFYNKKNSKKSWRDIIRVSNCLSGPNRQKSTHSNVIIKKLGKTNIYKNGVRHQRRDKAELLFPAELL